MAEPHPPTRRIAIDGPAASGKSAVGSAVARKLGFAFIDTGAIYRALTWLALHQGIEPGRRDALAALAARAAIAVDRAGQDSAMRVSINGHILTDELRSDAVERAVSEISAIPEVRQHATPIQRRLANGSVVMAGRDIGSVILPDAELKIFLDASPEERVRRRLAELGAGGRNDRHEDLGATLARRDLLDSTRATAPLTAAPDAVRLQTDGLALSEVISAVLDLARQRWPDLSEPPADARAPSA